MESLLITNIQKTLEQHEEKFKRDDSLKSYENAMQAFNRLISLGVAKKRGYNLLTIEDAHLKKVSFNVSK